MKKIVLGITAITLSICLTACGNTINDTTLTNLGNQLDDTSNTIIDMQTVNPTSVALGQIVKDENLYTASQISQQSSLNEQYYKAEILEKTAQIKGKLDENVKLSKNQVSALKDLILGLNKNTVYIQNTKGEMISTEKAISALKKNPHQNLEKLGAKYNKLACNSNIRMAYYENILNVLDQIDSCLNATNTENKSTKSLNIETDQLPEQSEKRQHFKKNIDTFRTPEDIDTKTDKNDNLKHNNSDTYGPTIRNIDTYNPYRYGNMPYGYGAMPYGGYGMPYRNGFMRGYPGGMYGSNYYNRATTPQNQFAPVTTDDKVKETEIEEEKTESVAASLTQNINKQHKLKNKKDDPIVVAF